MNNFFITGLPRSRTAWLANFFTYKNSFCFHEVSRLSRDVFSISELLKYRSEKFVGTADCLFPYYSDDILELHPQSKVVVVHRDLSETKESLEKFLGEWNDEMEMIMVETNDKLIRISSYPGVVNIDFEALNDVEEVKDLWNFITEESKFDMDRWNMLDQTRVNLIKDKWIGKINPQYIKEFMEV